MNNERNYFENLYIEKNLEQSNNEKNFEVKLQHLLLENEKINSENSNIHNQIQIKEEQNLTLQQELNDIKEELSWKKIKENSQHSIEEKLEAMINEKNKLAYERGALQVKVNNLETKLKDYEKIKVSEIILFIVYQHYDL